MSIPCNCATLSLNAISTVAAVKMNEITITRIYGMKFFGLSTLCLRKSVGFQNILDASNSHLVTVIQLLLVEVSAVTA